MRRIIPLSLALCMTASLLTGCGSIIKVHRLDVQQGNIITADMLARLTPGMSRQTVKDVLGDPVMTTVFKQSDLEYVYTFQPSYGKMTKSQVTVYFKNNKMTHVQKS